MIVGEISCDARHRLQDKTIPSTNYMLEARYNRFCLTPEQRVNRILVLQSLRHIERSFSVLAKQR